ncbi:copper chaperone PCu(A)C [Vibrio sinensis]|uniref:Copper chaperone PCu(A)C n=1 Tax=Vibrio sinensis TaxID=2302434 RepID=A0A3A6QQ08_9VIBR|nr:copper chaperone PCu(A)C [Vibrio sinensis]RJX69756.1 copper chaperone PCu(A)C [Vibrio sinensis]
MKIKTLVLSTLLCSSFAQASSDIMTHHAYARATPPNAPTSAVFVTLMNKGAEDRIIISATTPAAGNVELHDVLKDGDVMKMRQIETIDIPANGQVELKPGSFHIMLFDLKKPFVDGDSIDVELTFKNGEKQTFNAPIKKVMAGMKHHH